MKAPDSTGRDLLGDRAAQEPPEGMATRASTGRAPEVRGRVGSMGPRGRDPEVRDRKAPTSTGHGRSNGQRANDLLGLEVRAAQAGSAPPARRLASVWAIRGLEVRVLEGHGLEGRGRAVPGRVGLGRVLTPARPGVRTASRALPGASGAPRSRRHAGRAQLEPARGHGLAKTRGRALKASWAMASVSRDPRRPLRRGRAARRVRVRAAQPALARTLAPDLGTGGQVRVSGGTVPRVPRATPTSGKRTRWPAGLRRSRRTTSPPRTPLRCKIPRPLRTNCRPFRRRSDRLADRITVPARADSSTAGNSGPAIRRRRRVARRPPGRRRPTS